MEAWVSHGGTGAPVRAKLSTSVKIGRSEPAGNPNRNILPRTAKDEGPTTKDAPPYPRTTAASNKFKNSTFFSAPKNDASNEFRANSRK